MFGQVREMDDMRTRPLGTEPRADFGAWWMLGILLLLYIISFVDRFVIVMLVDPIATDLNLSDFEVSLILGPAFGVCYAIFGLPLGWAADKFDRRWVIFVGVAVWSLATMASGVAPTFMALLATRMLVAVGEASLTPAAHSMVTDRFPRERLTTAISIYSMGPKAGSSLAFIIGGVVIALTQISGPHAVPFLGTLQPWQLTMLAVGAPGIFLALLIFTVKEPARRTAPAIADGEKAETFLGYVGARRGVFTPLIVGFCLVSVASVALQTWVPAYMDRHFGWQPIKYGTAIGVISALAAFTLPLKGALVDWMYKRGMDDAPLRFYTWLLAGAIPVAAVAFFVSNPYVFLVCYGLMQVVALPYMLYASSTIQVIAPNAMRGRLVGGLLFFVSIAATMFGPTLVAGINDFVFPESDRLGWSLAIISVAGIGSGYLALRVTLRRIAPLVGRSRDVDGVVIP
jgi:MFS family permease